MQMVNKCFRNLFTSWKLNGADAIVPSVDGVEKQVAGEEGRYVLLINGFEL